MVVQRTLENLRERPAHQRRMVAVVVSCAVMTVLFFGWLVYVARTIQTQAIALPAQRAAETVQQVKDSYSDTVQFTAGAAASQSGQSAEPDSSAQIIDITNSTTNF